MGEIHVNMNITLDGVIQANGGTTAQDAGYPHGGWERPYGDEESGAQVAADAEAADALLLGHTTYEIFRAYWPDQSSRIGRAFNAIPKYVASRGTPELTWEGSAQVTDAVTELRDLRERHEQIHTWGSADLLRTLFDAGLVDRVNLWMHPVVLGTGKRLFPEGTVPTRFELAEPPRAYPRGSVLLRYRRLDGPPVTDGPPVADGPPSRTARDASARPTSGTPRHRPAPRRVRGVRHVVVAHPPPVDELVPH